MLSRRSLFSSLVTKFSKHELVRTLSQEHEDYLTLCRRLTLNDEEAGVLLKIAAERLHKIDHMSVCGSNPQQVLSRSIRVAFLEEKRLHKDLFATKYFEGEEALELIRALAEEHAARQLLD